MWIACLLLLQALTTSLRAGSRTSPDYSIAMDTSDLGGKSAACAHYTNHGSAGGVGGVSTVASPLQTAKVGYIAQLYDVTGLLVNSAQPMVDEGASLQLGAWQLLDDATLLRTDANAVTWGIVSGPITDITATGLATAGPVFQNTSATVSGTFGGFAGLLNFTVLDSLPDNFGDYAGDGLGDDWQVQNFGENNPLAAPALDPDGDGQTNQFEFTVGLIPNDPASVFHLRIAPVPGQPSRKKVIFSPRLEGRAYVVESRLTLNGAWQPLTASAQSDNGAERTVTDLDAAGAKFYRIAITKP